MKIIKMLSFVFVVLILGMTMTHTASANTPITANLRYGSRGVEVTKLQTLLAQNELIYPSGKVTGYFGSLTRNAVIQFQLAANIGVDGIVGPQTRAKINEYISDGIGPDFLNPTVSPENIQVSGTSAVVSWNTNEAARGIVYYSTTPITGGDSETAPYNYSLSGTTATESSLSISHSIMLSNLASHTTYYYDLASIDKYGNVTIVLGTTFVTQ